MNQVSTINTGNFNAMAEAMGMSIDTQQKSQASTLARLRVNHSPIMGEETINGKKVKVEVVSVGLRLDVVEEALDLLGTSGNE